MHMVSTYIHIYICICICIGIWYIYMVCTYGIFMYMELPGTTMVWELAVALNRYCQKNGGGFGDRDSFTTRVRYGEGRSKG